MTVNNKKIYTVLGLSFVMGLSWLCLAQWHQMPSVAFCWFKKITHLPCPSCGTTRSVTALLGGDVAASFLLNPLGIAAFIIMACIPIFLIYDVLMKSNKTIRTYHSIEKILQKRLVAVPLIVLVILNWVWNIAKEL